MRLSFHHFLHPFTSIHLEQKVAVLTQRQQLISLAASIACTIFTHLNLTALDQTKRIILSVLSGTAAFYVMTGMMKKINGVPSAQEKYPATIPPEATSSISEVGSSASVEEPKVIQETPYKAKIAIRSTSGGLVGPHKDFLTGTYKARGNNGEYIDRERTIYGSWTLEDGTPFSLNPDVLLLEFIVYDLSPDFLSQLDPDPLVLPYFPASFFEGKNEGDRVRLKYKNELVELKIDQNWVSREIRGAIPLEKLREQGIEETNIFADIFKATKAERLRRIEVGRVGFSDGVVGPRGDLLKSYTLEHQGTLFQFVKEGENTDETRLQQKPASDFRPLKNPRIKAADFGVDENESSFILRVEMAGINQQVDLVVNEKYLCVYAQKEEEIKKVYEYTTRKGEYLFILHWKEHFKGLSLEEMKTRITNAECQLANGLFTLKIERDAHI